MGLQKRWFRQMVRWLVRPSPAPLYLWPIIAAIVFVVGAAVPVTFLLARVFGAMIWIALLAGQSIAMVVRPFVRPHDSLPNQAAHGHVRRLLVLTTSAALCLIAGWLPLNTAVQFWLYRSQLEALAQRVPDAPVSYYGFGTTRIGPYVPRIDRFPHWLGIAIGDEAFCPENWEGLPDRHGVYFILEDDPDYKYNNSGRIHLQGRWYAEAP
jgi:hypothetical protein